MPKKQETHQFKCGHSATTPLNMGRGKARLKRIAEYFNRSCYLCKVNALHDECSRTKYLDGRSCEGYRKAGRFIKGLKRFEHTFVNDHKAEYETVSWDTDNI